MNLPMGSFSYRTTGWKNLSNCITDYIKTDNNGGLKMFWAEICLFIFFLLLFYFILRFSFIVIIMLIRRFTYLTQEEKHVSKLLFDTNISALG